MEVVENRHRFPSVPDPPAQTFDCISVVQQACYYRSNRGIFNYFYSRPENPMDSDGKAVAVIAVL